MNFPKGYLIAIGGAEDKELNGNEENESGTTSSGILKNIVELMKGAESHIEVITTATSKPEESYNDYKKAFRKLGCSSVGHLDVKSREQAEDKKILQRIEKCNGVMFTGGDQLRLCATLGGTEMLDLLKEKYFSEKFIIAGTSAGAAAMSNTMICGGNVAKAYFKGEVQLSLGFGLLPGVIVDTHFDKRGRFGRLAQAIAAQPGAIGIGLGEDTGVIIEKGELLKAVGSSSVVIIDGSQVEYNNIAEIKSGMPISVSNLMVHLMAHSDVFNKATREFTGVEYPPHVN